MVTLTSSDNGVERKLEKIGTYCGAIPRIYSGVVYGMCKLHAEPQYVYNDPGLFMLVGMDLMLSSVVDTLVLPYTIYDQSQRGSNYL